MNASTPTIDFPAIARLALGQAESLLAEWFPAGRKRGHEWVVGNLAGDVGESLSININTGAWGDFASDVRGGDLVALYAAIHRLGQGEAARRLAAELGQPLDERTSRPIPATPPKQPDTVAEWVPIVPIPAMAPPPPSAHPAHGKPTHIASYRNRDGQIIGLIYRCEPAGKRKQVVPLTWCAHQDGREGWQWKSLPKPRSLYGAELLDAAPSRTVLVVEGEGKCDAARRLVGGRLTVVAWPGGASAVNHADWSLLRHRTVILWPDADAPGIAAAETIHGILRRLGATPRVVSPPAGVAEKWDLADAEREGWTGDRVMDHCGLNDAEAVNPSVRRAANLPPIQVIAGEIDMTASAGEQALLASKLPVFRRDKGLVRPVSQKVPASNGRMTVAAGLDSISGPAMVDLLNQAVAWEAWNAKSEAWKACDPPSKVAGVILSRAAISPLPSIAGVITTPTLRPDGSLLLASGYDETTRLYHVLDPALRLPVMPEHPTKHDADLALELLSDLLREFPFTNEVSRAVALSAIITAVVRGALPVAPMHAFRASTAGSGKSYLADIVSLIATGRPCPVMAVSDKEDETEKRLVGLLLSGYPIISLDNVNGELGGDLLCQAIERPLIRARPLGSSEIVEIESRATILATGNAFRVRGDMTRRTLLASLDAKMERPELREFENDPAAEIAGQRGQYVAAVLVIVRAYLYAGKPGTLSPIASFNEWNAWVRGALLWLGCGDPAASMEEAREDDPELSELREVLGLWKEAVGLSMGRTVRELDELSDKKVMKEVAGQDRFGDDFTKMVATDGLEWPDLRAALTKIAGERGSLNAKRLGKWLLAREGRIADGLRLERMGRGHGGVVRWGVQGG